MNIFFIAVVLGVVEGLTEFIPVSSTGHLIVFGHWLEFTGDVAASFEIFIQLGAILAVVVLFRARFISFLKQLANPLGEYGQLSLRHLVAGIVPVVCIGFGLYNVIKTYFFSPLVVAVSLIVGGIIMAIVDRLCAATDGERQQSLDQLTVKQAFFIGCMQCFAVCPGVSRSGATIVGGIFSGLSYRVAAEFSFILAVPVMVMAVGYDLLKSYAVLSLNDVGVFAVGFFVSFLVAWVAIAWFLRVLEKWRLAPFGYYRIVLGIIVLLLTL